jgi:hypothetical protein
MNALTLANARPLITTKLFWIRANRVLAWTLIVSPPMQWLLHIRFGTGLMIDLGILVAHAGLSFALFGKPETKARVFSFGMHLFGFRLTSLSVRNAFLLTGYRVAAGMVAIALLCTPVPLVWLPLLYPLLRLPVSVCQHIARAVSYALHRWGMRGDTSGLAGLIVALYIAYSFINLVR